MILVHGTQERVQSERSFEGRRQHEQMGDGNNIAIVPANVRHQTNWSAESPFLLLFIKPELLTQVAYESVSADRLQLLPQYAMGDPLIDRIGRSLGAELESNAWGGRLFADSLKLLALAIHLIRNYSDWQQPLREDTGGLPQRKLQQAIGQSPHFVNDYINAHLATELTIATIAAELEDVWKYGQESIKVKFCPLS